MTVFHSASYIESNSIVADFTLFGTTTVSGDFTYDNDKILCFCYHFWKLQFCLFLIEYSVTYSDSYYFINNVSYVSMLISDISSVDISDITNVSDVTETTNDPTDDNI